MKVARHVEHIDDEERLFRGIERPAAFMRICKCADWARQWRAGSILARVRLVKPLVDPFATIVAAPHLTAHEPPRNRAPWHYDPPQMPEAGPSWPGFGVMVRVAQHGHITLHSS